jgi:hypothetical protein
MLARGSPLRDQALARLHEMLLRAAWSELRRRRHPVRVGALAAELGSTPNAIYKTMFDARGKIRAYLVAHGYLHDQESRKS